MFKSKRITTLYFIFITIIGLFWWFTYNKTDIYKLYPINHGVIDTTKVYQIAPKHTQYKMLENDTIYFFFNKEKDFVIRIKKDSLINYIFKKQ